MSTSGAVLANNAFLTDAFRAAQRAARQSADVEW